MIIKELILHNFGVYASTNKFEFHSKKPIVLIGGMNGRGKTTFLEAVLLALYGANSYAYNESKYKTYGQYLRSYVNVSDGTLRTHIDLEFVIDAEQEEVYKIHREWSGDKKRTHELIMVYKDQEYNEFLTKNWTMFIENILPSGLSNFFFFDGEKIAELAIEDTSNQMKESIKSLLGISVLETLEKDLGRVIHRAVKKQSANTDAKEIETLRLQMEKARDNLETIDSELEDLEKKKSGVSQNLEILRQEYITNGGDIIGQRHELFRKRSFVLSKIEGGHEQLALDAASELPLVLVKDLLQNISKRAEIEQEQKMLNSALRRMQRLSVDYERINGQDAEAISRFIEFVRNKAQNIESDILYNLSDTSLFQLHVLIDNQLHEMKTSVKRRQKEIAKLQEEADQLDSYLAVDIDEKAIDHIYKNIKELEQELIEIDVLLSRKREKRKAYNGEAISATSLFNKRVEAYLKYVELNDDSERVVKYSHMANTILDEYKIRLQKNKIAMVSETMTACYKKLANKKELIDKIYMDPITLDLKYIDADGFEINKPTLSAGEKQLMVISLLWSLALCSPKKLPVIIDTPLSRLDSLHRASLIQTYFPQAGEQTIILSTDSEIDRQQYELMRDNVGDEYTLVYDDIAKSTTIHRGYFPEVLNDYQADSTF